MRSRHIAVTMPTLLLVASLSSGCGKKEKAGPEAAPAPLASVNGVAITPDDVAFEIQRRRETGRPIGDAREVLDFLIERQVMLQAARSSGLLEEPAIKRTLENRELGQWLDRSLQIERDAVRVSDEELAVFYEANPNLHTRPAMSRLAVLQRTVGRSENAEIQASIRDELSAARDAFLADITGATRDGQLAGFGVIAASSSEDTVTRYRGGDLGWMPDQDLVHRIPAAVAERAASMGTGDVSEVIETENGMYVVLVIDRQPAARTPLTEVAPGLRRKLIREKQRNVERSFKSNLLAAASIIVDEQQAAAITIPTPPTPVAPALVPVGAMTAIRPGSETDSDIDSPITEALDE